MENNGTNEYTITVFTENHIGVLNRITIIFTRRHINIESLTVSSSEVKGVHRFTIVTRTTENMTQKIVRHIEKIVDVLRASYYRIDDVVYQEIALYKVPTKAIAHNENFEKILRNSDARVLTIEPEYTVIEKTGHSNETQELFDKLSEFGMLQFVRSGRIAVTKEIKELTHYLQDLDKANVISQQIRDWKLKQE